MRLLLRRTTWLLPACLFALTACNNPNSSENVAKKTEALASSPAQTSAQSPSVPAATATQSSDVPRIDPNAPFPALSGEILKLLEADQPELSKHREAWLKAERDAIAGAIETFRAKLKRSEQKIGLVIPFLPTRPLAFSPQSPLNDASYDLISSAYAGEQSNSDTFGSFQDVLVGGQMLNTFGRAITEDPSLRNGAAIPSKTTPIMEGGEVTAEVTISAPPGGPPTVELTTRLQIRIYALDANSKASITGILCPDTNGAVKLNLKHSSKGKVGKDGTVKYGRNLDVTVTATVGEDGNTASKETRSKEPDEDPVGSAGLGTVALSFAQAYWQNGGCVTINASSPGSVKPKATSKIPVTVVHKIDGSTVPAKVTATLAGGESVTPTVIPNAPGDLTHTAVDKDGASMTITLKATSRRGNASTDLTITTKGMVFKLDGGADEFHGTGIVCDFEKPFNVKGDGLTVTFTPSSKASGTYKYSGKLQGFEAWGKGTYTVQYNGDNPVHVTAKGPGTVKTPMGDMTADGTEEYSVSASQSGCPYEKLLLD